MAHTEQREYLTALRSRFPWLFMDVGSVLEIGSLDINGSVRGFFSDCTYVGVDIASGPGVDVVALGQELDYDDEAFDVVISAECFEHNPAWLETFVNMRRMASLAVIFTCATTGRAEHGTARSSPGSSPLTVAAGWDYYRNLTAADFEDALPLADLFTVYEFSTNESSHDLYFYGLVR